MDEDLKVQVGLDIDSSSDQAFLEKFNKKIEELSKSAKTKVNLKIGKVDFDGKAINTSIQNKIGLIDLNFNEEGALANAERIAQRINGILSKATSSIASSTEAPSGLKNIDKFLQSYSAKYNQEVKNIADIKFVPVSAEVTTEIETATGKLVSLASVYQRVVNIAKKARSFEGLGQTDIDKMLKLASVYYQHGGTRSFDESFPSDISLEKLLGGFKKVNAEAQAVKENIAAVTAETQKANAASTAKTTKQTSPTDQLSNAVNVESAKQQIQEISAIAENLKTVLSDESFNNKFTQGVTNDFDNMKIKVNETVKEIIEKIEELKTTLGKDFTIGNTDAISKNLEASVNKAVEEALKTAGTKAAKGTGSGSKTPQKTSLTKADSDSMKFSNTTDVDALRKEIELWSKLNNVESSNLKINEIDSKGTIKKISVDFKSANDQVERFNFALRDLDGTAVLEKTSSKILQFSKTIQDSANQAKAELDKLNNPSVKAKDTANLGDAKIVEYRKKINDLVAEGKKNIDNILSSGGTKDEISKIVQKQTAEIEKQKIAIAQRNKELNQAASSGKVLSPTGMATYNVSSLEDAKKDLISQIQAKGDTVLNVETSGIVDAEGKIKQLTVTAQDANNVLKEMTFTLKGSGDNSFLENTKTKIITLKDKADEAKNALKEMMNQTASRYNGSVDADGNISSSKFGTQQEGQVSRVGQVYQTALGEIDAAISKTGTTQAELDEIIKRQTQSLQTEIKALDNYGSKLNSFSATLQRVKSLSNQNVFTGQASNLKEQVRNIENQVYDTANSNYAAPTSKELDKLINQLKDIETKFKEIKAQNREGLFETRRSSSLTKIRAELESWKKYKNVMNDPEAMGKIDSVLSKANASYVTSSEKLSGLKAEASALGAELKSTGKISNSLSESLVSNVKKFTSWFGVSQLVMRGISTIRSMISTVTELDKGMTDLQVASGYTKTQVEGLMDSYVDLAKTLGTTATSIVSSADTWVRQGYSIEETTQLITNSTMLAKLGQLETAEATQYLTSAIKGYNVSVNDSLGIVDKLTAVDREAAVSAGGLAEAMARTASGARLAGVDMNKLIGYAAVIGETTQKSMETVGESLKSIFARMGNIKAGNLSDPETGESLSNVETALKSAGIKLRDTNSEFRNFGEVLDEIASKWDNLSSVQQRAIASALAGTHQYENFLVLMQNYGSALEYAQVAEESGGTALEKYGIVQDSIETRTQKMTASFQDLARTIIKSDWIKSGVSGLTSLSEGASKLIKTIGLLPTVLTTVSAAMSIFGKNDGGLIYALLSEDL